MLGLPAAGCWGPACSGEPVSRSEQAVDPTRADRAAASRSRRTTARQTSDIGLPVLEFHPQLADGETGGELVVGEVLEADPVAAPFEPVEQAGFGGLAVGGGCRHV